MKKLLLLLLFISSLFAEPEDFDRELYNEGEKIFEQKCSECHVKYMDIKVLMKNFVEQNNRYLNLKAPTGNEISYRLKSQIGSIDDMEFHLIETADFMKDYLYYPDKSKTICLEVVIRHFETMPSMKGKISEEEIETVNYFLYFLEGFNGVNEYYYEETNFRKKRIYAKRT